MNESSKKEVVELEDLTLIINGAPSPEASENFIKIIQQIKNAHRKERQN